MTRKMDVIAPEIAKTLDGLFQERVRAHERYADIALVQQGVMCCRRSASIADVDRGLAHRPAHRSRSTFRRPSP